MEHSALTALFGFFILGGSDVRRLVAVCQTLPSPLESSVGNPEGELTPLKTADIERRTPQQISLMPEKLIEKLTVQEFPT